jgi:putative membrane protein
MLVVASVLALLAALLHVYIFVMESFLWTTPRVRATFGITDDAQAEHTKPLAFNQGFYNLFLGVVAATGSILLLAAGGGSTGAGGTGAGAAGTALLIAGVGSMLAAALVLLLSDRTKARAAVTQGTLPLLALVALLVAELVR